MRSIRPIAAVVTNAQAAVAPGSICSRLIRRRFGRPLNRIVKAGRRAGEGHQAGCARLVRKGRLRARDQLDINDTIRGSHSRLNTHRTAQKRDLTADRSSRTGLPFRFRGDRIQLQTSDAQPDPQRRRSNERIGRGGRAKLLISTEADGAKRRAHRPCGIGARD